MTEPVPVLLPKLTMAATEGTFVEWLVGDGEAVVEDQPLYVMSTDKVDTEVASPATGILWHGFIEPGDIYPVGTELALIEPTGG
jgi:pyruvate/2-oxoglutarate dehydrogenase complex dihydrolipoamide acyltransferase (E2) component